jgi:hypothetical protein
MYVAQIWRYPVKSMAGEQLDHVEVGALGLAGDRIVHIEDRRGRVVTARTHPQLLGHQGSLDPAGEPRVDYRVWTEASVLADVERIVGTSISSSAASRGSRSETGRAVACESARW